MLWHRRDRKGFLLRVERKFWPFDSTRVLLGQHPSTMYLFRSAKLLLGDQDTDFRNTNQVDPLNGVRFLFPPPNPAVRQVTPARWAATIVLVRYVMPDWA